MTLAFDLKQQSIRDYRDEVEAQIRALIDNHRALGQLPERDRRYASYAATDRLFLAIRSAKMTPAEFRTTLKSLGMTQRALALRLGLSITTVNRWATGKAPVPQYAVAYLGLLEEFTSAIP